MNAASTEKNTIYIRRFHANYLVSSNHPSPERIRARLDEVVTKSLSEALASTAEQRFSTTNAGVLLIRRLEIDVDVNAAWERDQCARNWARQIVRSLDDIRQGKEGSDNVLWFSDRAAYLASFLVDIANGSAWGKWYYEPFDGLRMLPTSAALRSSICDQPATGLAALLRLRGTSYVIQALTTQDARRVLESLSGDMPGGDARHCFQALWSVWDMAELGPLQAADEWHNALRLYLRVLHDHVGLARVTLKTSALALLRLARRCIAGSPSTVNAILTALKNGDVPTLYVAAGAGDAKVLMPLFHCSPQWLQEVGDALRSRYTGQGMAETKATGERRHTSFGSLFVLLPLLDALPLERATEGWPDAGDTSATALVRFLLFVKSCGQANAHRVFFDPLVRDLLGIDSSLSPATVAKWGRRITQANLESFLQHIAAWQHKTEAVGRRTMILARATLPGRAVAVLLDCQRGSWLTAMSYQRKKLAHLVEQLRGQLTQYDQEEIVILSDELFVEALRSAFPSLQVEEYHSASATRMAEEDASLKETLARLDKLTSELSYLSMASVFCLSGSVDLALSVASQGVLRAFAWRLPGFARSSLPYLTGNFLDFPGSIEDEPARHVVRLGRPPLNFILNITGMARSTYRVSWLDERPFALFQEE